MFLTHLIVSFSLSHSAAAPSSVLASRSPGLEPGQFLLPMKSFTRHCRRVSITYSPYPIHRRTPPPPLDFSFEISPRQAASCGALTQEEPISVSRKQAKGPNSHSLTFKPVSLEQYLLSFSRLFWYSFFFCGPPRCPAQVRAEVPTQH